MEVTPAYGRFARDVTLVGAADFLRSLRTIFIIPILAKFLGAEDYGVWVQVKVTAAMLAPLVLLGLNNSIVRFLGGEQEGTRIRGGFNSSVCAVAFSGLVMAVFLFFYAEPIAGLIFQGPESAYFVKITALFILLDVLDQLALNYFQAFRQMAVHLFFILVEIVVEIAVVASLAVAGYGLASIVISLVGWKCIVVLFKLGRIWSQIGFGLPTLSILKSYFAFGLPLLISGLFYLLINYSDRYLINFFLGIREVGIYSVAYAVGSLLIILVTPIDYVLYPTIVDFWNRGNTEEVSTYIRYSIRYSLLIAIPVFFYLTVISEQVVLLFSTREFLSAAICVPLIALGFLIFGIGIVGERIILLAKRPKLIALLYAGFAALNILLNIILIPRFGILGAAIATLVTFGFYTVFTLSFSHQYFRISVEANFLWKSIVAGLLMAVMIKFLNISSFSGLIGSILSGGGVYFCIIFFLKGFSQQEIAFFKNLVVASLKGRVFGKAF